MRESLALFDGVLASHESIFRSYCFFRPHLVQEYHYLFQIAVTFKCKELFVVTNEETNEIVQVSYIECGRRWVGLLS